MDPVRLASRDGRVALTVVPYGLTVHALEIYHAGVVHDVLVGPEDPAAHRVLGRRFFGSIVGRYANRLPAGRSSGAGVEVDLAEWGGAGISHHGGPAPPGEPCAGLEQRGPLDTAVWTQAEPTLFGAEDVAGADAHATFALESPAGDQGYPGRVRIEALFTVRDCRRVVVAYRARLLDGDKTPLNLAQHWGFNLAASDPAFRGAPMDEHTLQLGPRGANLARLVLDERGVPTGALAPCAAWPAHNWGAGKRVGEAMPPGGYDDFYVWGAKCVPAGGAHVATLCGPTGLALRFYSNQAGVQLYTANSTPTAGPRKRVHRPAGGPELDGARCAAFLEFSAPHATFLRPSLWDAAGGDTVLRAGEVYDSWVAVDIELYGTRLWDGPDYKQVRKVNVGNKKQGT